MTMPDPRASQRPAPAGGARYLTTLSSPREFTYSAAGNVAIATGLGRQVDAVNTPEVLNTLHLHVGTAPTGADIIVNVNINGTSIFGSSAYYPHIVAGTTDATIDLTTVLVGSPAAVIPLANRMLNPNDVLTFDITQIGTTTVGANPTFTIDAVQVGGGAVPSDAVRDGYVPAVLRNGELLPLDSNPGLAPVEKGKLGSDYTLPAWFEQALDG